MTLDASIGGVNANSYLTYAEADTYFATRLNSTEWDEEGGEDHLIFATQLLDEYDFIGTPTTTTQALKWPRIADEDDLTILILDKYTSTVIPPPVKRAVCELALWLLQAGASTATTETGPIQSLRIGSSVAVTYDTSGGAVNTSTDFYGLPMGAVRQLRGLRIIPVLA